HGQPGTERSLATVADVRRSPSRCQEPAQFRVARFPSTGASSAPPPRFAGHASPGSARSRAVWLGRILPPRCGGSPARSRFVLLIEKVAVGRWPARFSMRHLDLLEIATAPQMRLSIDAR